MKRGVGLLLGTIAFFLCHTVNAHAAPIPSGTLLTITPGYVTSGKEDGLMSGSGFTMGDGIGVGKQDGWIALLPGTDGGIKIGSTQPKKAIFAPWYYFLIPQDISIQAPPFTPILKPIISTSRGGPCFGVGDPSPCTPLLTILLPHLLPARTASTAPMW